MNSRRNRINNDMKEIEHDKCSICGDKHCCRGLCRDIVELIYKNKGESKKRLWSNISERKLE